MLKVLHVNEDVINIRICVIGKVKRLLTIPIINEYTLLSFYR